MEPFTIELPADAATPRLARRAVADRLGDVPGIDELLLCVSEVVTNAVIHAGTPRHLSVRIHADRLVVEVADGDPRPPVRRPADITSPTGRGLHLLDDLTLGWGSRPTDDGKVVWFGFPLQDQGAGPDPTAAAAPSGSDGVLTVVAEREVDLLSAAALRDQLEQAIEDGVRAIVVDLSGCEFLDSTGLSVLATTHLRLRRLDGHLEAAGATGPVANVLRLSGVADLLGGRGR